MGIEQTVSFSAWTIPRHKYVIKYRVMYSTKFLNAQHVIFRSTAKEISITICHVSHAEGVIDVFDII